MWAIGIRPTALSGELAQQRGDLPHVPAKVLPRHGSHGLAHRKELLAPVFLWLFGPFPAGTRPAGAAKRCLDGCQAKDRCPYDAEKIYITNEKTGVAQGKTGWPCDVLTLHPTEASIRQAIQEGPYGRCVYFCDNDVVDHQVVNLEMEGGLTVNFTMSAFTAGGGRYTNFMGAMGDMIADMAKNTVTVTPFGGKPTVYDFNLSKERMSGHAGGDSVLIGGFPGLSPGPVPTQHHHPGGLHGEPLHGPGRRGIPHSRRTGHRAGVFPVRTAPHDIRAIDRYSEFAQYGRNTHDVSAGRTHGSAPTAAGKDKQKFPDRICHFSPPCWVENRCILRKYRRISLRTVLRYHRRGGPMCPPVVALRIPENGRQTDTSICLYGIVTPPHSNLAMGPAATFTVCSRPHLAVFSPKVRLPWLSPKGVTIKLSDIRNTSFEPR